MMRVYIELLGISRLVAGEKEVIFNLPESATCRDIVRLLKGKYPGMIGDVLRHDSDALQAPNIFALDGKGIIHECHMDELLQNGDRITLMSVSAGG